MKLFVAVSAIGSPGVFQDGLQKAAPKIRFGKLSVNDKLNGLKKEGGSWEEVRKCLEKPGEKNKEERNSQKWGKFWLRLGEI